MNMEGWVVLGADRQEIPVTLYPGQDLVEADLSDIPDVSQDLYWHSPSSYLGDKVRGAPTSIRCGSGSYCSLDGAFTLAVVQTPAAEYPPVFLKSQLQLLLCLASVS